MSTQFRVEDLFELTPDEWCARFATDSDVDLQKKHILHNLAILLLSHLLKVGVSEDNVEDMLDAAGKASVRLAAECARRTRVPPPSLRGRPSSGKRQRC